MDMKRIYAVILILGLGAIVVGIVGGWNWAQLEAIATWFGLLGVIAAILLINVTRESTTKQLEATRKSTNAQLAVELFRELRNSEAIKKLRHIYDLKQGDLEYLSRGYLSSYVKEDIDYVLDRLDTLGNLVIRDIVDRELAIETYGGPPALRVWHILRDYIRMIQKHRGYYAENFEVFTRLSLDYFKKEGIKIKFYGRGEEDRGIDLVEELTDLIEAQKNELPGKKLYPRSLEEIKRDRKNQASEESDKSKKEV